MKTVLVPALRAFIVHKDKVLILRESSEYESSNQGKYDLPGGKIKPGEPFGQALKREVKEEAGIDIRLGKPFSISEWKPMVNSVRYHIVATFIECFADSDDVRLGKDHDDFKWIEPEDYKNFDILEPQIPAFEDYIELKKRIK